jgi:tripartite-type tricarboxylate transporter receptor subunit TctC
MRHQLDAMAQIVRRKSVVFIAMLLLPVAQGANAQPAETFYAAHAINLVVPFGPGGYYDIGARLIARHFGKHIPGRPTIVVQNQPSAGGIGLAARFAAGSSDDGLLLGTLQRAVPQYALIGYQTSKFDPLALTWIGSLSAYETDSYVLIVNAEHPAKTLAELKNPNVKTRLGAGRAGSANLIFALVAKDLFELNVNVVRGYEGTAPIFLALQRGEVDGLLADLSTVKVALSDLWASRKVVPLIQFGRKTRLPELADIPTARELISDPRQAAFLAFAETPFFMALPIAGPAAMPRDRAKALQDAFMAMAADPEFLQDAKKMNYEVDPISADAVREAIMAAAKAPTDVMARFRALVSGP